MAQRRVTGSLKQIFSPCHFSTTKSQTDSALVSTLSRHFLDANHVSPFVPEDWRRQRIGFPTICLTLFFEPLPASTYTSIEMAGEWLRNPFLRREAWAICVCCGMNRCEMMQGIECAHIQRPMAQRRVTGSLKQIFSPCHFSTTKSQTDSALVSTLS